ncbi:MAG: tRNA modification GTPase MnmE [Bacteroidia bacterium]|nr:tRNA modification GTPase MnmE [Bacteroidia bacterium]
MTYHTDDTIIALSTPPGSGAIAVLRLSGNKAFEFTNKVFRSFSGKDFSSFKSHTLHFGSIYDKEEVIDEVVISLFKNPLSFTGEDVVEISCHGSAYIQQRLFQLFIKQGARVANPGEYTMRAFMNGRMDLSQAEAVADLVASTSEASHRIALQQMRGGFSGEIKELREQLIHFASMIELELDFSEEDVQFANRNELKELVSNLITHISDLASSFALGNVIKNGIPVAIAGEPNAGKSTLLNVLLNEERAIVSDIPGTTRDTIEDEITLDGIRFRFIDTAGIRETSDKIESLGIDRTFEKINTSAIVILLFDATLSDAAKLDAAIKAVKEKTAESTKVLVVANKSDLGNEAELRSKFQNREDLIFISAKQKQNIEGLKSKLMEFANANLLHSNQTIITNVRHFEALNNANVALKNVYSGLEKKITGDLLAVEIRRALYHLSEILGQVTTEDLLGSIFSRFCIGK